MKLVSPRALLLTGACVAALGVNGALAGGFGLHEQSTEALGESFAGVAAGAGGLSSMFWNPATLTKMPGINTSSSYSLILPYASDTFVSSTYPGVAALPSAGNTIGTAVLPASYGGLQLNDQLWLGVSMNSPFGLATKNNPGTAPGPWGRTTSIFTTAVTPELAFKINDWVSVGVGVQLEYMEARETSAAITIPASALAPVNTLKGSSYGAGFTAGITLTPMAGTELGIGYRSQVRQDLKGSVTGFTPGALVPFYTLVKAPITLPDSASIGLRQRIAPQFTMLAGVEWTGWSRVKTLTATSTNGFLIFPAGTPVTVQNLNYKDGWMFSLGGEYNYNQALTFRAGVAYEIAPIDDTNRDVRLLDSDRVWLSAGASYRYSSKLKFDVSYAHIFYKSGTISIPAAPAATGVPFSYNGTSSAHGDVVSVGMSYRWDEPIAAVVAKY